MIVDVHGHVGPWFFSMEVGSIDLNERLLDRFGIDRQLVSHTEAVVYDAPSGNRSLADALARAPRLRGLVVVDPRRPAEAERDLTAYLARPDFVGVKIHPVYARTPIDSPAMRAVLRVVAEHGAPALVHTWDDDILDLAAVTADTPGLRVIAAHMAGPGWRRVPEAAARSDRVWFEPCWSQPASGRMRWVADRIGTERLLFGTDATLIDPSYALAAVESAGFAAAEKAAVLAGNACELFGLEDLGA